MAADPLQSARTKFKRANVHTGIAKREARRFIYRQATPTFRIEPKDDMGDLGVGDIFEREIVLTSSADDVPASFAARFGDAIHNYRSALDHIAWQLVLHGAKPSLSARAANRVQFPIYDTRDSFRSQRAERLPGVNSTAVAYIEARHLYVGGNATNYALLGLARLSNDDKHRSLHVFVGLLRTLQSQVTYTHCRPITWENPPGGPPELKDGAIVTRFSCEVTAPNPKVEMELRPQAEISIENGVEFSAALESIRAEVAEILDAPEILAAVT
jgi:hypothetical protein